MSNEGDIRANREDFLLRNSALRDRIISTSPIPIPAPSIELEEITPTMRLEALQMAERRANTTDTAEDIINVAATFITYLQGPGEAPESPSEGQPEPLRGASPQVSDLDTTP